MPGNSARSCWPSARGPVATEAAVALAAADRGLVIAPAGHGKTQTVAQSVLLSEKPQLVLTHTHAGVHALRRRLADVGVAPRDVRVDTIAGFALSWTAAFPATSGWSTRHEEPDWGALHPAAIKVLSRAPLRDAVRRSYRGVIVDEYQDCDVQQHDLVLLLADTLPVRILGDPLQGVIAFAGDRVEFELVEHDFPILDAPLDEPWRWAPTNPALGQELLDLRNRLLTGETIDFASCVEVHHVTAANHARTLAVLTEVAGRDGTAVAICRFPPQAIDLARRCGGPYVSLEEANAGLARDLAERISEASGFGRAVEVIDAVAQCTTKVGTDLKGQRDALAGGQVPAVGGRKQAAITRLDAVRATDSLSPVPAAIRAVATVHEDARVFRPMVLEDAAAIMRLMSQEPFPSVAKASGEVVDGHRRSGRRLPRAIVGTPARVKGLEFDHAVVIDPGAMTPEEQYVALTRAAKTVTVVT